MKHMETIQKTAAFLALTLAASGCLTTRSQLRGEEADQDVQQANVQEVQPKDAYVIDEIKSEITRLTGRIEEMERGQQASQATAAASAAKTEEVKALETRIVELEKAQAAMLDAIKKIQASTPPPDSSELFEKGKGHYTAKEFDAAIDALSEYMKNPNGKHAEEATYLRAESYFAIKDYKKAIIDYSKFPDKFTKSKRMPLALFKIGNSFEALGMKDDAKGFYQELADRYPQSAEAKKAKAKLK